MNAKTSIIAAALVAASAVTAEVRIDFADPASGARLTQGAYADPAERVRQTGVTPDGLRMEFDSGKIKGSCRWCTVSLDRVKCADLDWTGRKAVFVLRMKPFTGFTKGMALNFTDRDGETFQFQACGFEEDVARNELRIIYKIVPANAGAVWTRKANGSPDAPLRLVSLNGHYETAAGFREMTLVRIEDVPPEAPQPRNVAFSEAISIDAATYPGARPFPAPEAISLRLSRPFKGRAVLTLAAGSNRDASRGGRQRFTCEASAATDELRLADLKMPDGTYHYISTEFKPSPDGVPAAPVSVVSAAGFFRRSSAEAVRVEVETGNALHIVRSEKPGERPVLVVSNPTQGARRWKTSFVFSDAFGRWFDIPFDREVAPGEKVRIDVPWPLPAKGIWWVDADVRGEDGSAAHCKTQFAWIDLHERTPYVPKPKFRFGIHYHGTRYWPRQTDVTVDALVAAGAKFTRTDYDFMFGEVMPSPATQKWAKADAMMAKFKEAGLATDIIIYSAPTWAVDKDILKERAGLNRGGCSPTKPGLFRAFARDIAARYGTDIDYYEVGNEWDLAAAKRLHIDEALRIQQEAMEGVHEGCPGACVIPNGWTYPSSRECYMNGQNNPGMYEAFCARPDLYDAWAIHCHGPFPRFVERIQGQFLPVRESTGMKKRPWLCNETALTCYATGEREAARTVWAKILYAWAWGASDYIWYNLKATGWGEGVEPGYGLLTADLRPRAGYAAFAALTKVFQGLDADARIHSRGGLHVLRFKGRSEACDGLVVAGWDWAAGKPRSVRIRTDAARAETCDFMGNLTPCRIESGIAAFEIGRDPQALLLHGATTAEAADRAELGAESAPSVRIPDAPPDGRVPDFRMADAKHVYDYHLGNPLLESRLWKDAADHSADVWLCRDGDDLVVRIDVTDDADAQGDAPKIVLGIPGRSPVTIDCAADRGVKYGKTRSGTLTRMTVRIPGRGFGFDAETLRRGIGFSVIVSDDDGHGVDSFLRLSGEVDGLTSVVLGK